VAFAELLLKRNLQHYTGNTGVVQAKVAKKLAFAASVGEIP